MADENKGPKKGYAAPLEGAAMAVLGAALAVVGFKMMQSLGMRPTAKLGISGPTTTAGRSGVTAPAAVAGPTNPMSKFSGPKFNENTMQ